MKLKPKLGELARIVHAYPNTHDGEIAVYTGVYEPCSTVRLPEFRLDDGRIWRCREVERIPQKGDRVVIKNCSVVETIGATGTVVYPSPKDFAARTAVCQVKLDHPVAGRHRVFCPLTHGVDLLAPEKTPKKKPRQIIHITTDGKTTTAVLREGKTVLKTASAKCSPGDTFSFAEGARIAFERLQGRDPFPEEKKPERPEKLVCVNNKIGVTELAEGKIYRIFWENDLIFDLLGTCYSGNFVDGKYFAPFSRGDVEFIPLVED